MSKIVCKCASGFDDKYEICPYCGRTAGEFFEDDEELKKGVELAEIYHDNEYYDILYKLAKKGNAEAQLRLGAFYESGRDGHYMFKEAAEWYQKSAEQEYTPAMYTLGFCYECGRGVTRNYQQAIYWYLKAADKGNNRALHRVGLLYEKGDKEVEKDLEKALYYYQKLLERDLNGSGVANDIERVKKMLNNND